MRTREERLALLQQTTQSPPATASLVLPTVRVHDSYLAALEEFQAEGRNRELRVDELRGFEPFLTHVTNLHLSGIPGTPLPAGLVPWTTLWYLEGAEFIGRLTIRHTLDDLISRVAGHIGYEVRPSRRGEGHATRMLQAALPVANGLGIEYALVTCKEGNVASRRVIEAAGGELEDVQGGIRRYWVRTY